jgi:hypothetical protein
MEIRVECDTEIRTEHSEVYEPPMFDEVGGFAALTRAESGGSEADGTGYYPQ